MQIEGITKRVAEELKISQELSEEVCRSEFKFVLDMIKLKETINLIHLGKFQRNAKYKNQKNEVIRYTEHLPGI